MTVKPQKDRMTVAELREHERGRTRPTAKKAALVTASSLWGAEQPRLSDMLYNPVQKKPRAQKYGNQKTVDRGITFDSKAEHRRWIYLTHLEKAREISKLARQVPFQLIPELKKPSGGKERATIYIADFTYTDHAGRLVVEDVKGAVTPEFRLKRKLMLHVHGIEVQEVRS